MTTPRARACLLLPLVAVAALVGCENKPAESGSATSRNLPQITLTTPEDAARTALSFLRADLRATARHDEETAEACLEQMRTVVSTKALEEVFARLPRFKVLVGGDVVKGCVNNWAAVIAYYAEGLHFEQMRRVSETRAKVAVVVPASGPEDQALIQVTCVRDDDSLWRVLRVEFVVEAPATRPAPPPPTQPAHQP